MLLVLPELMEHLGMLLWKTVQDGKLAVPGRGGAVFTLDVY